MIKSAYIFLLCVQLSFYGVWRRFRTILASFSFSVFLLYGVSDNRFLDPLKLLSLLQQSRGKKRLQRWSLSDS